MKASLLVSAALIALLPVAAVAQETASTEVDELVVTATRTEQSLLEVPASVSVQSMELLEQRGFFSSPDELRGVPGVFFRRGEGDNDEFPSISVRGVTGNHGNDTFLALVDGIPFISSDEEVVVSQIPMASIDRVEVVRGPVSALYGRGGISGAINYLTRSPMGDATTVALSAGSADFYRGDLGVERDLGAVRFLVDARYEQSEGWRASNERRIFNLFSKVELDLSAQTRLTGYLNYGDRRHEVGSVIPTFADGTAVPLKGGRKAAFTYGEPFNEAETVMGALRLDHRFDDSLSISLTAHVRSADTANQLMFYDSYLFDPANEIFGVNGYEAASNGTTKFLEGTVNWSAGRHEIVAGVNLERVDRDSRAHWSGQNGFTFACGFQYYAIQFNWRTGQIVNANHPCFVRNLVSDTKTENSFWSAFVQDEIALTDRLTLTLGGRYDSFERDVLFRPVSATDKARVLNDSADAFSPKASLSYRIGEGSIYATYGRGFSSNFGPAWQWDANRYARDAEPTTLDSYEIGVKGRALDRRLTYTLAGFYLEQKNRLILIDNPDPQGAPQLATSGQLYSSRGIEATAALQISPRTSLSASYTYTDPKWEEYDVAGLRLTGLTPYGVPEHMAFVELAHRFSDAISGRVSWEGNSDYYLSLDNAYKGGALGVMNASLSLDLPQAPGLGVDIAVTNLLDGDNDFIFGGTDAANFRVPGIPRQVRATVRAKF